MYPSKAEKQCERGSQTDEFSSVSSLFDYIMNGNHVTVLSVDGCFLCHCLIVWEFDIIYDRYVRFIWCWNRTLHETAIIMYLDFARIFCSYCAVFILQ